MPETTIYQTHTSDVLEKTKDGVLTLTSKSGCFPIPFAKAVKTIIVDPNTKLVTVKERSIPFAEIEKFENRFVHEQPSMEIWEYIIALKSGERIPFCQLTIAMHDDTMQRITAIFNETLAQ